MMFVSAIAKAVGAELKVLLADPDVQADLKGMIKSQITDPDVQTVIKGMVKEGVTDANLPGLVKTAVDEANVDLITDVQSLPDKLGGLIEKIPGVPILTQFLAGITWAAQPR